MSTKQERRAAEERLFAFFRDKEKFDAVIKETFKDIPRAKRIRLDEKTNDLLVGEHISFHDSYSDPQECQYGEDHPNCMYAID